MQQQQLSQVRMLDDIFFLELCLLSIKAVLFCLTPPVMSPGLSDPQQPFLVLTGLNNSAQSSFPPPNFLFDVLCTTKPAAALHLSPSLLTPTKCDFLFWIFQWTYWDTFPPWVYLGKHSYHFKACIDALDPGCEPCVTSWCSRALSAL